MITEELDSINMQLADCATAASVRNIICQVRCL